MKKIYIVILMAVLPIMLWAQPVATHFEDWVQGNSVIYTQMNTAGVYPGPASQNQQTWDFSSFTATGSPVTTRADSNGFHDQGSFPAGHTYCLYTTDSTVFPYVYFHRVYNGANHYGALVGTVEWNSTLSTWVTTIYPDSGGSTYQSSPMHMNDRFTDSVTRHYTAGVSFCGWGLDTLWADAWGKVILPGNIVHPRTLRVKTTRNYTDTTQCTSLGQIIHSSHTTYAWYDSIHVYPILRIDSVVTPLGTTKRILFSDIGAGINGISQAQVTANIFPNPNNGNFTLHYFLTTPKAILNVRDVTGRLVYSQNINGITGNETIDVSSLSQGIYYWELAAANEISANGKLSVIK
jgi:hypothetical protein